MGAAVSTVGVRRLLIGLVVASGIAALVALLAAWRVDAAPGDSDATFVPTAGCRAFDYRPAPNQVGPRSEPLGAGEVFVQQITGGVGECVGELAIPGDAVGVAMNVTAVGPTAQSNLRLFPADLTEVPLISNLNFSAGQAPFPNKVDVSLSPSGAIKLFNQNGQVSVVGDVVGYYSTASLSELHTRLAEQDSRIAALEAKLADVTVLDVEGHRTVRFSGVNVQVVDGSNNTECNAIGFEACNGVGNLMIGYNEDPGTPETRSGSHNLVVGFDHDWTSFSGLLGGSGNTVSGPYASVVGGVANAASGDGATVAGGFGNTAGDALSSIAGGRNNAASGLFAAVFGGVNNEASQSGAAVVGGSFNAASAEHATVSGGIGNAATGRGASVSGGNSNIASGQQSSVVGGDHNTAAGDYASVSGGNFSVASGESASVSGGNANQATGTASSVVGGSNNTASAQNSAVAGGLLNEANGGNESIAGGDGVTCSVANVARVCGEGPGGPL